MKIFTHGAHRAHEAKCELIPGELVPTIETADRIDLVWDVLSARGFGAATDCPRLTSDELLSVHDHDYLSFLETAWDEWVKSYSPDLDGIAFVWPHRNRPPRIPQAIEGRLGYYFFDGVSPITEHVWSAATGASGAARAAANHLSATGEPTFALVRPPGHHAGRNMGGGTSYLNHTALAAATLGASGARVAILDVDAHHGNGTQDIFWANPSVLTVSIHADPAHDYPYFSGYADETGGGSGEGFNVNLPLAPGSTWSTYAAALGAASARIRAFAPDFVVIALGVDGYRGDPSGKLDLQQEDFSRIGDAIAALKGPKMFVFEGGYDKAALGDCVARVLKPNSIR
ncbi:histone deacetylase family protein [Rhizobium sp. AG855]|uniref:histone deacetylase family protein n=1 Tax=Rhizobium sp. AG855 TaxID=2183898 RepID=UPI000E730A9F|nr:histone deacetylase family protein [Rhizobium sp. AG855]RKE83371.1 acetoin utilization deacetylase AcuC-like enzyme [Rhizobium sp. AG855]